MSKAKNLKKNPSSFRLLTGLSIQEFDRLLAELEPIWNSERDRRAGRKNRRRKPGAGRHFSLSLEDMLLVLLMYYRTYITYVFLGFIFSVDAGTICRIVRLLEPLLAKIFRIPENKVKIEEDDILEAFVDGTERPTNRPKHGQKKYYSGKKKRHTMKAQIIVVRKKTKKQKEAAEKRKVRVAAVSPTSPGSEHDKKLYDKTRTIIPPEMEVYADSGYQGTQMQTPTKKPRKGELTQEQKESNRKLSQKRIVAEHGIGKMKIWRITSERYRNLRSRHTIKMKNVAGLQNRMYG
jgi:IS5 family transposase